jgi:hypothetical protein
LWDCGRDCGVRSPAVLALRANQDESRNHPEGSKEKKSKNKKGEQIKTLSPEETEKKINTLLNTESSNHCRYSAQEFFDNLLCFGGFLGKKEKVVVRSDGKVILETEDRSFQFTESKLTKECINRFRNGEIVSDHDLVSRLTDFFSSYVFFKNERILIFLSVWVMGTYLFRLFRCYGYIWINSSTIRCGKSHLLDLLSRVSFNSTKRLVNPSEASIFRRVAFNRCTLVIDEVEKLSSKDKDKNQDLITLLNSGFEEDGDVTRCEGKTLNLISFNTYSPKILAGINPVTDTIEDRSFPIKMDRKKITEKVERFNVRKEIPKINRLVEDCYIWALNSVEDIKEVYEGIDEIQEIKNIDDRSKDIWESQLIIAKVIDAEPGEWKTNIFNILVSLANEWGMGKEKKASSDNRIVPFIEMIKGLFKPGESEIFISSEDMFTKMNIQLADTFSFRSKVGMAYFLKQWGFFPGRKHGGKDEEVTRGYWIPLSWVEEKEARYV